MHLTAIQETQLQGDTYVLVLQNKAIQRPKCSLTKKIFFSQILIRFISPIRYKTVFFYHQLFTSKKPLVSKTLKFIGHTSSKYPVVNKNYLYHFMILKFHKISNCSKTSLVRSKIFSERLGMIISQYPYDFQQHGIALYQEMLAVNPVFCVCQNGLSELLTMIMLRHIVEAVWWLMKYFLA